MECVSLSNLINYQIIQRFLIQYTLLMDIIYKEVNEDDVLSYCCLSNKDHISPAKTLHHLLHIETMITQIPWYPIKLRPTRGLSQLFCSGYNQLEEPTFIFICL